MKIHKIFFIYRALIATLLLFGGNFFICKSFVYASDDSLMSLQKDVLAAKEKQAIFADKAGNVDEALGNARSSKLQEEAENLILELTAVPAVNSDSKEAPPLSNAPPAKEDYKFSFPSPRSFETKPNLEPKRTWVFNPMPKILGIGWGSSYKISDGESIYKVAVSDGQVSLKEAIQIGIANNLGLHALKKKVDVADSKWTEAKRALFPTLQLQFDENGGRAPSGSRFYRGRDYKVNGTQPLYYGGELVLTAKQAEENLKSSRTDFDKAKNELIHDIRKAYYGVVKTEYNAQYQADLQKESSVVYKIVKMAHDQKLVAEVDYLNVESQYQQANFSFDSTHNDLLAAYLTLRQTLNLDSGADLPLDLELRFKKIKPDFSQMLDFSLNHNPEILAKELAYLSARDGVDIYEAKKRPRFDLRGSYGTLGEVFQDTTAIEDGTSNLKLRKEWYLGVHGSMPFGPNSVEYDQIKHVYGPTVSAFQGSEDWRHTVKLNLMDKFSDITDAKGAQATLLQAQADWQKVRNDVIFKLKDDFYNLQKSLIQMDSAAAKVRYQEKQNGILKYTMSFQETTPGSYLEGLIEQASNRFAFIQAVTDYNLAVSSIGVACGDPFYFEEKEGK